MDEAQVRNELRRISDHLPLVLDTIRSLPRRIGLAASQGQAQAVGTAIAISRNNIRNWEDALTRMNVATLGPQLRNQVYGLIRAVNEGSNLLRRLPAVPANLPVAAGAVINPHGARGWTAKDSVAATMPPPPPSAGSPARAQTPTCPGMGIWRSATPTLPGIGKQRSATPTVPGMGKWRSATPTLPGLGSLSEALNELDHAAEPPRGRVPRPPRPMRAPSRASIERSRERRAAIEAEPATNRLPGQDEPVPLTQRSPGNEPPPSWRDAPTRREGSGQPRDGELETGWDIALRRSTGARALSPEHASAARRRIRAAAAPAFARALDRAVDPKLLTRFAASRPGAVDVGKLRAAFAETANRAFAAEFVRLVGGQPPASAEDIALGAIIAVAIAHTTGTYPLVPAAAVAPMAVLVHRALRPQLPQLARMAAVIAAVPLGTPLATPTPRPSAPAHEMAW